MRRLVCEITDWFKSSDENIAGEEKTFYMQGPNKTEEDIQSRMKVFFEIRALSQFVVLEIMFIVLCGIEGFSTRS